tara:strand:+ start:318 stop:500 length:183 start_codon:yes stop_codon:yes gene_type:complete
VSHAIASDFLWLDFDVEPILRLGTCACHNLFLFPIEVTFSPLHGKGVTGKLIIRLFINLT